MSAKQVAENQGNEKVIAKSQTYNLKKWLIWINAVVLAVLLIYNIFSMCEAISYFNGHEHSGYCYGWLSWSFDEGYLEGFSADELEALLNENCPYRTYYTGALDYAFNSWEMRLSLIILVSAGGGLVLVSLLLYAWLHSFSITVSNKRIFGNAAFGKRVELPVDSVSAVATSWLKGIAVATSSGRIAFMLIKNRDEIHQAISDLLIQRQREKAEPAAPVPVVAAVSNAEELKKYKELLDMGVITQEEFDAKKKQILDL